MLTPIAAVDPLRIQECVSAVGRGHVCPVGSNVRADRHDEYALTGLRDSEVSGVKELVFDLVRKLPRFPSANLSREASVVLPPVTVAWAAQLRRCNLPLDGSP